MDIVDFKFLHRIKSDTSLATPRDTGNLDQNAKRVIKTAPNQFSVIYKGDIAGYGYALNKGTYLWGALWERKIRNPHQRWFDIGIRNAVLSSIASAVGNKTSDENKRQQPAARGFYAPTDRQQLGDVERVNYERSLKVQKDWNSRMVVEKLETKKGGIV